VVLAVVIVDRVLGKVLSNTSTRMQNKRHINLLRMIDDLKLAKYAYSAQLTKGE